MIRQQLRRIVLTITIALAAALVSVVGSASTAAAAGDTADNTWVDVGKGWVMWNDYADDDHDHDLDDLWVDDWIGDGLSVKLYVYSGSEVIGTAHSYGGDGDKVYIGNVPNGEKVLWKTCVWNNGAPDDKYDCSTGMFVE